MKPIVRNYLKQLRDYCNKYDNIIMNQVYALGGAEEIFLSDVYSDFDLISKDEYDRNIGIKNHPDGSTQSEALDINKMIENIDKKIYELTVSEEVNNPHSHAKKIMLYVYAKEVDSANNLVCLTKSNAKDTRVIERIIKIQDEGDVISKIHNKWFWIRGFEISRSDLSYIILEPYWYKMNDELTQEDLMFMKSKDIIESLTSDKDKALIEDSESNVDDTMNQLVIEGVNDDAVELSSISGSVILSEPGGGKTTFLKHLIYEICNHAILEEERFVKDIAEKGLIDCKKIYIPILVRTRDISNLLEEDICLENIFEFLLEYGISNITGKENTRTIIDEIFENNQSQLLFVIDGFEELEDKEAQVLLAGIQNAYKDKKIDPINDRLIISSRHTEYGYQRLVDFCVSHNIDEKYIVFSNKNNAIENCISNWFKKFKQNAEDNKNYFISTLSSNSDIRKMIHTPLELTGLIMLCQSQSALPTDITVLYRSIMEIWLTYAIKENSIIPFFSLSDIFLELSSIAFYMAEFEDEKLKISREKMIQVIKDSRSKLRRYYRSKLYVEAASENEIDLLLDFWLRRNIFVKKSKDNIYEFAHREYQSYLIGYAIVNNFIYEGKHINRIEYFKSHMDSKEDFWDRAIIFAAFMSPDIHDSLIDHIFKKLENYVEDSENILALRQVDRYYLSLLLQLTNSEGFYFDDGEYEKLFNEIFRQKTNRVNMLRKSVKGLEIKKLLSNGRKKTNTFFLQKAVQTYQTLDEREKDDIVDIVGNLIFHVLWNCDAENEMLKKAFSVYLCNWITMDMVYEIRDSVENNNYNKERVQFIRECGLENINRGDDSISDCYMIISIIMGFLSMKEDGINSLYKAALSFFHKAKNSADIREKTEAIVIAINLVFLITWFVQINEDTKCGCSLKEVDGTWNNEYLSDYKECILYIVEYMKIGEVKNFYRLELYATYRDLCMLKKNNIENELKDIVFDETVLMNCLLYSANKKLIKEIDKNELSYALEIIANYPLNEKTMEFFRREDVRVIWKEKALEIKEYYEKQLAGDEHSNLIKTAYLLKLIVFSGYYDDESMQSELKLQFDIIREKFFAREEWDLNFLNLLQRDVYRYFKIITSENKEGLESDVLTS